MAFPTQTCGPVDLPVGCCRSLWDLTNGILATVAPYVEECVTEAECLEPMRYFVSMGRPEGWQSDFLALYLENIRVDQLSQRSLKTLMPPVIMGQFRFLLVESNYPTLQAIGGDRYMTPTDDQYHVASMHGYSHAQAMLRGLLSYAAANDCKGFMLRDLQPTRPEVGNAGWVLGFDMELPN